MKSGQHESAVQYHSINLQYKPSDSPCGIRPWNALRTQYRRGTAAARRTGETMNLRKKVDRFYLDMVINELRLANQHDIYQSVTYNSILYLDIIAYHENCTVSYIADVLHVARSAVTLKVKELERQGLVTKTRSEEDGRVHYLKVNEKLLEEYKAYDRVLYGALDEVAEQYTPEQLAVFCGILDTINRRFSGED